MAYYARTSHLGDIEFFLKAARADTLTGELRKAWLSLRARAPRLTTRNVQGEYQLLLTRYWVLVTAQERRDHPLPAARFLGGLYPQSDGLSFTFGYLDTETGAVLDAREVAVLKGEGREDDGTEGQDRENDSDTQDRENDTTDDDDEDASEREEEEGAHA
jgi:hypothetical protein